MLKIVHIAAVAALAAGGLAVTATSADAKRCITKSGQGWGFTESMARFQAWEIVAQVTGNWPIKTDEFRNERYKCRKDGAGVTCVSRIDVCKK